MGADIVIAVSVGTPLATRQTLSSFVGVTGQAFGFLTVRNAERSARARRHRPPPRPRGHRLRRLRSDRGGDPPGARPRNLAQEALARLSREPWSPRGHIPPRRRRSRWPSCAWRGTSASTPGSSWPGRPEDRRAVPGAPGCGWRCVASSACPTSSGCASTCAEEPEGTGVVFRVKEKPWGPTYLHFGLEFVDDLEGDADYALKANITRANLNRRGGEWRNDLQVGSRPSIRTELSSPSISTGAGSWRPG